MIKSKLLRLSVVAYVLSIIVSSVVAPQSAHAQFLPEPGTPLPGTGTTKTTFEPLGCASGYGNIAPSLRPRAHCFNFKDTDPQAQDADIPPECATTYAAWLQNPNQDFWVEDPEVTSLGKGGERSRQFLLWVLTHQSIDDQPVVLEVWKLSQNVALFIVLLVVIVMGIGVIIGQRGIGVMGSSFSMGIEITPLIIRVAILLLYIIFSARLVLLCIQLSDVTMEFFIRTLGVRDLFNIFFIENSGGEKTIGDSLAKSEQAYRQFLGCTNWNIENQEMVTTSKAMVRFTNMTYYFLGGMLLLRKVVLWFLLIVSPFLAILAPFVFIRNIGWIWIGVFFQWVFYGPLMALFLGGLANIWNSAPVHIPYVFDFSRVHKLGEVVYPTSINILYGGPAQQLGLLNTSNYVDTFAEYIISLIMLWTVMILPWWLLRIFRDYCCDGIYAMRNVLLAMYDSQRGGPNPTPPGQTPTPTPTGTGKTALEISQPDVRPIETRIKLETVQDIKRAQTQEIVQSINMQASNLKEVARMETNKVSRESVVSTLNQIQNPFKAETPSERQRLMNLRNEVQTRAREGDKLAQRLAAVTAKSSSQERVAKEQIMASLPKVEVPTTVATTSVTQIKVAVPESKKQVVVQQALTQITQNQQFMQRVATDTGVPVEQATHILQTVTRLGQLDTSTEDAVSRTAQEVGVDEARVKQVVARTASLIRERGDLVDNVARQENVDKETVTEAVQTHLRGAVGVNTAATQSIVQRVFTQVALDNQAVTLIARQAQVSEDVARKILGELGQVEGGDMAPKDRVAQAAVKAGAQAEQVKKVVETTAVMVNSNQQVVQKIATEDQLDTSIVEDVTQEEMKVLSKADKEIEDYVPQSQKVSIEDYEEVKGMWVDHYDKGEIPVTENVKTREEWLQQDTIRITNILNKLMSSDHAMQEQGLTEVGYILPIFMVNNLSGEELLVYLKAKIQAAKEVARSLEKESALRKKIKAEDEETLVDVELPQAEEEKKHMDLTQELEVPEETVPGADAVSEDVAGDTAPASSEALEPVAAPVTGSDPEKVGP